MAIGLLGTVLFINSYLAEWLVGVTPEVASASALAGALLLGGPLLLNSWRSLRRGEYGINELVSLALLAAMASGDYRTAGVVAFFMVVGELVETRTAAGARASIEALVRHTPTRARRLNRAGTEEVVASAELRPGDRLRIRPGHVLPADGVIRAGQAALNEASITGESLPADKSKGGELFAGARTMTPGTVRSQPPVKGRSRSTGAAADRSPAWVALFGAEEPAAIRGGEAVG
jgi:Cd2+/Zn2+-exporting ATPase